MSSFTQVGSYNDHFDMLHEPLEVEIDCSLTFDYLMDQLQILAGNRIFDIDPQIVLLFPVSKDKRKVILDIFHPISSQEIYPDRSFLFCVPKGISPGVATIGEVGQVESYTLPHFSLKPAGLVELIHLFLLLKRPPQELLMYRPIVAPASKYDLSQKPGDTGIPTMYFFVNIVLTLRSMFSAHTGPSVIHRCGSTPSAYLVILEEEALKQRLRR